MKDIFGMKIIQDSLNLILHIKKNYPGESVTGILENIIEEQKPPEMSKKEVPNINMPKCPDCNSPLMSRSIIQKNKFNYKSQWFCVSGDCVYERYSKNDLVTELKINGIIPKRIRR